MKKIPFPACAVFLIAMVIAVGSVSFLGPCVHEDGSFGACHWAGRSILGIGALLAAQSILALILKQQSRTGVYITMVLTALLGMLTPGTLIGLCGMATMRCRAVMQPAMVILFVLAALFSALGAITDGRRTRTKT